jgi:hypothetical protein
MLQFGQLPYLTVLEIQRIKAGLRRYSFPLVPSDTSLAGLSRPSSGKFDLCGRLFMRLEIKFILVAASLALAYGCFFVLEPLGTGYSPSALASTDQQERYRTMKMFDNQGAFPVSMLFFNVDVVADGSDMLALYDEVAYTPRTRPDLSPPTLTNLTWAPPWSSFTEGFYFQLTKNETKSFRDLLGRHPIAGVPGICSGDGDPSVTFENYNRWPALLRLNSRRVRNTEEDASASTWNEFGDRTHLWNKTKHTYHPFEYADQFPIDQHVYIYKFYITEVSEDKNILRAVQSVSDALSASRFENVQACGPTFTQYEGLIGLEDIVMRAARVILIAQFVFSWVLLGFRLATAHLLSSAMILMEFWGLMTHFAKLNVFSVLAAVLVANLIPTFTSNTVVAFKGNLEMAPAQRLSVAMRVALPATFQGSLCILGAILPLTCSHTPLIVQYFAWPAVATIFLGLLHGSIFAPAILACVAQDEVQPVTSLEDFECLGLAIEVPKLQAGPNLLESAVNSGADKLK